MYMEVMGVTPGLSYEHPMLKVRGGCVNPYQYVGVFLRACSLIVDMVLEGVGVDDVTSRCGVD